MAEPDSPEVLARFESGLGLVEPLARTLRRSLGPAADLAELANAGRLGLLGAARRFDPTRGVPFGAYATFRIRGAMLDSVREAGDLPRSLHRALAAESARLAVAEGAAEDVLGARDTTPTAALAERALDQHLGAMVTAMTVGLLAAPAFDDEGERVAADGSATPEERVARAELQAELLEGIAELPAEEATLVRRHYLEGERFDHIALELGLSKSWASRLHTRALGRLERHLRRRGHGPGR